MKSIIFFSFIRNFRHFKYPGKMSFDESEEIYSRIRDIYPDFKETDFKQLEEQITPTALDAVNLKFNQLDDKEIKRAILIKENIIIFINFFDHVEIFYIYENFNDDLLNVKNVLEELGKRLDCYELQFDNFFGYLTRFENDSGLGQRIDMIIFDDKLSNCLDFRKEDLLFIEDNFVSYSFNNDTLFSVKQIMPEKKQEAFEKIVKLREIFERCERRQDAT